MMVPKANSTPSCSVFVDFGRVANRFLSTCGSKSEPSIDEVTEILISDPKKFYELSGGYEK